jgi:hypothetical protein
MHGPSGILSTLEFRETQFVLGTELAADVWTIAGEGVAARHAMVRVAAGRIQVEDLAGGTLLNGHPQLARAVSSRGALKCLLSDSDVARRMTGRQQCCGRFSD